LNQRERRPAGSPGNDIDTKYRTLLPQAPERQIEAALAVIHRFRKADGVSKLIGLLLV
jgi:hypothetical protein